MSKQRKKQVICYFGTHFKNNVKYDTQIKTIFNNYLFQDCLVPRLKSNPYSSTQFPKFIIEVIIKSFSLFGKFIKKHRHTDQILLPWPSFYYAPIAKVLSILFRKKIIYYAFISNYDTRIYNSPTFFKQNKFKQKFKKSLFFYYDKIPCFLSNKIILDTDEHIKFFSKKFNIPKNKFKKIHVGKSSPDFKPLDLPVKPKTIVFFGSFLMLHGVTYIIEAARLLKNEGFHFYMIGNGPLYQECLNLSNKYKLNNITFTGKLSPKETNKIANQCEIGLGIFGDTKKASRVIPYKIFNLMAIKKPIITGRSPAIEEILTHKKNAYLCNMADSPSLANAIKKFSLN